MLALLTVFNSWAFLETRRLVRVFPEPVRKLWNNWELRVLVLVSLTLQLCLLHFGSRRRYSVKSWLSVFLWLSYLAADSVATVTLGVISNNQGNCNDSQLQNDLIAFWAPFLLLHLGGQDTITAYAVQDNELWLRHLLGLVVQSGVALYIFLSSWKVGWLSFLTIPMLLAGFIKYAERTFVLRSANYDPVSTLIYQGKIIQREIIDTASDPHMVLKNKLIVFSLDESNTGSEIQRDAFSLFKIFRCLFLNQKVKMSNRLYGHYPNFHDSQTAWKMIEDELGYAYDVFYTKAPLFFTAWGFLFRLFSFTSILFVFVLFIIRERHKHPQIDLIVTYLLLVGAVLIEIYAVILLCASDWPLRANDNGDSNLLFEPQWPRRAYDNGDSNFLFEPQYKWLIKHITHIRNGCAKLTSKQRWSNTMGQLNLLGLCLNDKSLQDGHGTSKLFANLRVWAFNQMLPKLNGELEMHLYRTHKQVSDDLKESVFSTFREKLCSESNGFSEEFDTYITNGIVNVETYQSIIIWHIATDLCFYTDSGGDVPNLKRDVSKDVSDYMMYILAMCPSVLSTGNATLGFKHTCTLVKDFLKGNKRVFPTLSTAEVCGVLISEYSAESYMIDKYLLKDSLISLAVLLAKELNQKDGMWETLSKFWVENLAYVATLCQGNNHAQLLRIGGEFLTHVWLLIEHFNLSQSFQKSGTRSRG